jgi:hypothetical protein
MAQQKSGPLADPKDAINVMDFEAAARQALPPAHFGYLATGVDDDATLQANREGFKRIQLRPRRLVDVRTANLGSELFGYNLGDTNRHRAVWEPESVSSGWRVGDGAGGAFETNAADPVDRHHLPDRRSRPSGWRVNLVSALSNFALGGS